MRLALRLLVTTFVAATPVLAQTTKPTTPEQILTGLPMATAAAELARSVGGSGAGFVARIDDRRRFALGIAQTLRAVERLQGNCYALGIRDDGLGQYMPFTRIATPRKTPQNRQQIPEPKLLDPIDDAVNQAGGGLQEMLAVPVSADLIDKGLTVFRDDLAVAIQTLDGVNDSNVALTLPVLQLRLDTNGFVPGGEATLGGILERLGVTAQSALADNKSVVRLDYGDVCWLRGYLHLVSAMTELTLAYDKAELIDVCGEAVFHRVAHSPNYPAGMTPLFEVMPGTDVVDVIAFVHKMKLPVKDAKHMAAARGHLKAMIAESRKSWDSILKETDNEDEWIPGPSQQSVLRGRRITQEQIDGWLAFLDDGDAILDGTKLIPFWRAKDGRGVDVNMLMDKPPAFDPIMWVHGAPLGPYLRKGPLANGDTYRRLERLLGGDFFTFAAWVN